MSNSHKNERKSAEFRILIFRCLTGIFLICTGVLCATFGYILLSANEDKIYLHQYHSLIKGVHQSVTEGVDARSSSGKSFAASFGGFCPNSDDWPNCWVPYVTFVDSTASLATSLNMGLIGMLPIVRPDQVTSFETFATQIYANESYPANISTFIRAISATGETYRSSSGYNPKSKYQVLIPTFEFHKNFSYALMYDTHAPGIGDQSVPLDEIIDCHLKSQYCASYTDLSEQDTTQDGPMSYRFFAISPAKNRSDLVGFVSLLIRWESVFTHGSPSVLTDIDLVLETDDRSYTYHYLDGEAFYKGPGDLHESKFNHLKKKYAIEFPNSNPNSYNYTMTFYPTQRFYNTYHSDTPFLVCLISLLIVLGTSLIFLVYDFFVKRESLEQTRILEAKQTYVRFISHVSSLFLLLASLPSLCLSC
jgi:hypothetical protein